MPPPPLTVEQARRLVIAACAPLAAEQVDVAEALGRVLAEDVLRGLRRAAVRAAARWTATPCAAGEPRAHARGRRRVARRRTRRTARSAPARRSGSPPARPIPDGADAVRASGAGRAARRRGDRARRRRGRQQRPRTGRGHARRETAAARRRRLGPAELGVAVGAGRAELDCARRPRVAVLATGDELRAARRGARPRPDPRLEPRRRSALWRSARSARCWRARQCPTIPRGTRAALASALEAADVVCVSGGVSVGPHDHVKPRAALARRGGALLGRRAQAGQAHLVRHARRARSSSGCPATPSRRWSPSTSSRARRCGRCRAAPRRHRASAVLDAPVEPQPARDQVLRCRLSATGRRLARDRPTQESHVLSSMLGASAFAPVVAGEGQVPAGERVPIELIF